MTIHKSKGLGVQVCFSAQYGQGLSTVRIAALLLSLLTKGSASHVADVSVSVEESYAPNQPRISMDTLPYQQNLVELQLASLSEQMRLLYVAMTWLKPSSILSKGQSRGFE